MKIQNITIIGLGLIGGSIAKALINTKNKYVITAYDKPEIIDEALKLGVIDSGLDDLKSLSNTDLVFLCLPVDKSLEVLKDLALNVNPGTIVTDVCGVKAEFENIWNSVESKGVYIGGHPMTGKEKNGFENSDLLLFENSIYILSDTNKELPETESLISIIESLGARPKFVNPFLHDKIIAHVSHLPQLLAVTLMNAVAKNEDDTNYLDFAAGGFRDMTRIASSEYKIWEPIIKSNKTQILDSLDTLMTNLKDLKKNIESENIDKINNNFEHSRIKRDEIPRNTKGFITPLFDIFVFVTDQPGVISSISSKLYENNINIKDIELLKIRVGTGGTFRLSFDSEKDANNAKLMLEDMGYQTDNN